MSLTSVSNVISPQVDFSALVESFRTAKPFNHVVIDDFFEPGIADGLASEFPAFDSDIWAEYNNPIEIKKLCNRWDKFPKLTYSIFNYLNSPAFVEKMSLLVGNPCSQTRDSMVAAGIPTKQVASSIRISTTPFIPSWALSGV